MDHTEFIKFKRRDLVLENIFYLICENPGQISIFLKLWNSLQMAKYISSELCKKVSDEFICQIDDIEVDCPNAKKTFLDFLSKANNDVMIEAT